MWGENGHCVREIKEMKGFCACGLGERQGKRREKSGQLLASPVLSSDEELASLCGSENAARRVLFSSVEFWALEMLLRVQVVKETMGFRKGSVYLFLEPRHL